MRDPLLRLAAEARQASTAAHRAHRDGALTLGADGAPVLAALSDAAGGLGLIGEQLERLAAEMTASTPEPSTSRTEAVRINTRGDHHVS
jgi:hypothetical protein